MFTDLVDTVHEIGYSFSKSKEQCRTALVQFGVKNVTPAAVAKVLGFMARVPAGFVDPLTGQNPFIGNDSNWPEGAKENLKVKQDSGQSSTWNVEIFIQTVKELVPSLQGKDIVKELDYPGFYVSTKSGFENLVKGLSLVVDAFPIDFLYSPWKNQEGQVSWISNALKYPDVFCFANFAYTSVDVSFLEIPPDGSLLAIATWMNLELVEILLKLSNEGLDAPVYQIMLRGMKDYPDLVLVGILQTDYWNFFKKTLVITLFARVFNTHLNTISVLRYAWYTKGDGYPRIKELVMIGLSYWCSGAKIDPSRLDWMFEVFRHLEIFTNDPSTRLRVKEMFLPIYQRHKAQQRGGSRTGMTSTPIAESLASEERFPVVKFLLQSLNQVDYGCDLFYFWRGSSCLNDMDIAFKIAPSDERLTEMRIAVRNIIIINDEIKRGLSMILGHKEFEEEDFKALGKVIEINLVTLTENSSFFGGFLKSLKDIDDGSSGAMPKNIENKVTWISKNFYRTESKSQQLLVLALASFLFCSRSYEKFFCIHKEFVTGKQVWKFRENVQQTHDQKFLFAQKLSEFPQHFADESSFADSLLREMRYLEECFITSHFGNVTNILQKLNEDVKKCGTLGFLETLSKRSCMVEPQMRRHVTDASASGSASTSASASASASGSGSASCSGVGRTSSQSDEKTKGSCKRTRKDSDETTRKMHRR